VVRVALVSILTVACAAEPMQSPDQVTGVIIEVQRAQGDITGFTVDAGSETYEIVIDPGRNYGFDLEHLVAHRATGDPVRVDVDDRDGRLVALTILDA
jgi:hypothetical protein